MLTESKLRALAGLPLIAEAVNRDALLLDIAKKRFGTVETLETRMSDGLDFHDVSVWSIKKALEDAFDAGIKSAEDEAAKKAKKATATAKTAKDAAK